MKAIQTFASGTLSAFVLLAAFGLLSDPTGAQELPPDSDEFFEDRIRPLLIDRCEECHSGDQPESEFSVESLAGLLRGGTRGPAIVSGDPEHSLLILAVNHADQLHMPPESKIPAREIADLTAWVKAGANWPGAESEFPHQNITGSESLAEVTEEHRAFWSFRTPVPAPLPSVANEDWLQSPIDHFILAKLEEAGLSPAPPAESATWLRRVTFDLIGLPPTPQEAQQFLADTSPDAKAKVVDRLLASPRYGERWARHWLDVARYADSNGLDENLAYANAYRYRDYVIHSMNQDKPYDRFLIEQIAGDLLPVTDITPLEERLIATGFLSLGAKMLAEDDPVKMQMDIIDEQIDTIGRAVLGLTLGCARCHDHKFDPIPTADYYALAGIFKSTRTMENYKVVARWNERPLADPDAVAARDSIQARIDDIAKQGDQLNAQAAAEVLTDARRHAGDYLLAAQHQIHLEARTASAHLGGESPVSADNVILIEAENYQRGNVLRDTDTYGIDIGVLVNAGQLPNYTEYDFEVPSAGTYQIEVRFAAAESRPCKLQINDRLVTREAAAEATGSWFPEHQQWRVEGLVELQAGPNVLRLEQPHCFPHIDKLLIAPATDVPPASEPLDAQYLLIPEITAQWINLLRDTNNENPFLAFWRARATGLDFPLSEELGAALAVSGNGNEASLREIAQRLQSCASDLEERRKIPPADGTNATAPVDGTHPLDSLLYGPANPYSAAKELHPYFADEIREQIEELDRQENELRSSLPVFPEAMAVADDVPQSVRVHIRGSHITLGAEVPRGFPRVLVKGPAPHIPADRSGRLELAQWLTEADHPLTARVMVNRIWQAHFGEGLVRSPDNFGMLGEQPTHPALLDYLAIRLIERNWSLKSLHRAIVLSSAYEMSTQWNESAFAIDPENRLYWRCNRRRLEAEAIRDSILAVSGSLDLTMGGTLLPTKNREYVTSTANVNPVVYESRRRSIYLPVVRSALYEVFQAFDFPDPSVGVSRRDSTTVAPQALFMMNSELVSNRARQLADALRAAPGDDESRIRHLFQLALTREPTDDERRNAREFVERMRSEYAAAGATDADLKAWQSLCRAIVSTNEFIYIE